MAKMLFAFTGWLIGYDGHFLFDNIGDSYIDNNVPYVGLRSLPALLGALTVPVVFMTMRDSGYGLVACIIASSMVLFGTPPLHQSVLVPLLNLDIFFVLELMSDNAQLAQQRLILLDATLVFSMAMSIWMYVRFYRYRHMPFSRPWWTWLIATGVSLSFVMSTKYVGLFTFVTIGSAVAYDLWNLLDYRRGLPMVSALRQHCLRFQNLTL
jgi:dolichyl-phosphate-mannose-protein mannosyltransferase